jgi:hypothetical protein
MGSIFACHLNNEAEGVSGTPVRGEKKMFTLEQTTQAERGSRCIALLFH